jgi:hypothetical protein
MMQPDFIKKNSKGIPLAAKSPLCQRGVSEDFQIVTFHIVHRASIFPVSVMPAPKFPLRQRGIQGDFSASTCRRAPHSSLGIHLLSPISPQLFRTLPTPQSKSHEQKMCTFFNELGTFLRQLTSRGKL